MTDEQLQPIMAAILDPANQPVLIHCEHGRSRTGVIIAAYRILAQGWTYEQALGEAARFITMCSRVTPLTSSASPSGTT